MRRCDVCQQSLQAWVELRPREAGRAAASLCSVCFRRLWPRLILSGASRNMVPWIHAAPTDPRPELIAV